MSVFRRTRSVKELTVSGDLTVSGTTTTVSSTNTVIADKFIELGNGVTGTPSGDAGIVVERGSSTNAGLIWDESADTWKACTTSATGASSGDLTLTDAALATAAITASGNITTTGDLILDDGGSLKEAGGTAAITFDGSGHVTKIGQDSMSSGDVLTWDGSKFVGEAPTVGDITGVTAGVGLSGGGASGAVTLTLDLSELSDVTPVNGDKLATLDSDGSTEQLTTVASLATLFAGTGLTASSSVIGVDASQTQITAVGTIATGVWQGTAIASAYIAADAITGAKIADDAIDSEHYTDGSIDTAHIADDQVTLAKMAGLARGKFIVGDASGNPSALAAGANGKILVADANGDPSWTTLSGDASLSAGALTIATGAIEHAMLGGDCVDGDNIADDSINSEHYVDGSIDTAHIADDQVTLAKMAGLARGKIIYGDASGNPAALAAGANGKLLVADANGDLSWTTVSGDIGLSAGAMTIQTGAVEHAMLGADAVDGDNIADDSINSEHYVDGSIDTAHIADDQVTLAKMAGITRGSIIIGNASGDPALLAAGSNNYVLTSDGTDIAWAESSGGTDLNGLSAAAVDVANDSIGIIDANDSNNSKKESIADLATAMAGAGIAANAGVLMMDISDSDVTTVTAIAADDLMAISDESATNDPSRNITTGNLAKGLAGIANANAILHGQVFS
jgi:hypothetical protein